jgi:hypothetical protein
MIRPHERATLETGVLKMWDLEAEWRANPTGIPRSDFRSIKSTETGGLT